MKSAIITGVTGQDGSYLAEFLLQKGYRVWGLVRRSSDFNSKRIDHLLDNKNFYTYYGDVTDAGNLYGLLKKIQPDEIYNLAAQSHVGVSFELPEYSASVDGLGVCRLLSAITDLGLNCKFYQASTSELFGGLPGTEPQHESTPFAPRSPYAAAKLYGYWITKNYREAFNCFAVNGILFNHESPRRGKTFITKKVTRAVAAIERGEIDTLRVGNLDAKRDWGYAPEYVEAMWQMMQLDQPVDLVLGTGKSYTVRSFIEKAFCVVGIDIIWEGKGSKEVGYCSKSGTKKVVVDPFYYRPTEVASLVSDSTKAQRLIGWNPQVDIDMLVKIMVEYDLKFQDYGGEESFGIHSNQP